MKYKLLKNKNAFLARTWLIAFAVGLSIIILSYFMVQGLATNYDNTAILDSGFQHTYDKYSELQENVGEMQEEVRGPKGLSFKGIYEVTFGATFTIIALIFDSVTMPGEMLYRLMIDAQVPRAIALIIGTLPTLLIFIMIVLVVISSISRGKL